MNVNITPKVSQQLNIPEKYIITVLNLLEEGATIPFIARYRKEKTAGLDEEQLRKIVLTYESENKIYTRREEVLRLINEKGKMTPELEESLRKATSLKEIEDLYLPYREKKKTRASEAMAKGLEGLATWMLACHLDGDIEKEAAKYLNDEVPSLEEAIKGAQDIIAEIISDNHDYRNYLRKNLRHFGKIKTTVRKNAVDERKVYVDYYDFQKPLRYLLNHQVLAINRGEKEKILKVDILTDDEDALNFYQRKTITLDGCSSNKYVIEAIKDGYSRLLFPSIERETRNDLTEVAHEGAIEIFKTNLEQLLLTPPLKGKWMLGLDPAFRTGCKLAVINPNGDFIKKEVIYPHQKFPGENVPLSRYQQAEKKVADLIAEYQIELIAIGNGTASRESEEFIAKTIKKYKLDAKYIIVNEAGASVYSASDLAKQEFPDLVVEERSAISIARRVIDPLSELIKIDPKSIGVGQYQHDVNQTKLAESLDFAITKVVNNVGVNLNSASPSLLSYVSGLNKSSASNIIQYRQENGQITSRDELKKVKGIGPKSYEQSVGFLKILESSNPLDKTFIHPDNYQFVEQFLEKLNLSLDAIGTEELKEKLELVNLKEVCQKNDINEYTLKDIIEELSRPLRDIRDDYPMPLLKSDILQIEDLKEGMLLEGTVRSIVDFGAFIDIGLKNDALVHRSKLLPNNRNAHPLDVLALGQIVEAYVLSVDLERKRVNLSLFKVN